MWCGCSPRRNLGGGTEISTEFLTEYSLHLHYAEGIANFLREEKLPFAPFIGLTLLDDALGEFKLEHIAWYSEGRMFLCQATVHRVEWSITQAKRYLAKAGWVEEPEARSKPLLGEPAENICCGHCRLKYGHCPRGIKSSIPEIKPR
jgi:hypothetical protein